MLGGRHLKGRRDNQSNDGVGGGGGTGEAMRMDGTRGGGRLPIVLGGEWSDEKKENREGDGASDFDGSVEWRDATTNPKSAVSLEFIWERRRAGRRGLGRTPSHLFGLRIMGQQINRTKFVVALEGRQSTSQHQQIDLLD